MNLAWGHRTYIMGVLNVTPDSFSGDGLLTAADPVTAAVHQGRTFAAAGADILDVGGESTRPGHVPIPADEEIARVVPVITALRAALPQVILSIDTSKAAVARAALTAGANWINDVSGGRADPAMLPLAAHTSAPIVLMDNRSQPDAVETDIRLGGIYIAEHTDEPILTRVRTGLADLAAAALAAGVQPHQIILDPGIGFGKTVSENLALINHADALRPLGYPLLIGPSRKGFIGRVLNVGPDDRLAGTAAAVAVAVLRGADIVRVHDVAFIAPLVRMLTALTTA